MKEKDFNESIFPQNRWFTPSYVIDTFNYYLGKYSLEKILKHRNTKKLKEMWSTAVFTLGYQKMTQTEMWIRPVYDRSPDTELSYLLPHPHRADGDRHHLIQIEVTEWDRHIQEDLATRVFEKIKNQDYEGYQLLVHITKVGDLNTNLDQIADIFLEKAPNLGSIWVVVGSSTESRPDNHIVVQLYKEKAQIQFSIGELLKEDRSRTPNMLEIYKGNNKNNEITEVQMILPDL